MMRRERSLVAVPIITLVATLLAMVMFVALGRVFGIVLTAFIAVINVITLIDMRYGVPR